MRVFIVLAVIALVVALAADNRQEVPVEWLFGEGQIPLYQMFLATFTLGIVVGIVARSSCAADTAADGAPDHPKRPV